MIKGYKKIKDKKAFTLIELLVIIAVLAVLVLIAVPRLTGYTQKAELVRIQHDTKVMEQEMKQAMLDDEVSLANWDDNAKDLGALILKNELFEKEGFAERVDKSHLERHYNKAISVSNGSSELGVGGTEIPLFDNEQEEVGDGYKIIPDDYKSNIKTRLSGTFYTNDLGKVYYEHDKPLTTQKDSFIKKCDSPVAADLGYTFNYDTMTITDYDHREQHLVIPDSFKNPETDECVPVRIIGKGAFMIGGYKSVVIPESVHTIEDEAFLNNEFTDVYIPHSVDRIGSNAFAGDYISSVTIGRRKGSVNIGGGAFYNRTTGRDITPRYKIPSAGGLGYIFDVSRGAIVSHSSSNKVSSSSNKVLTIPSIITVNGVEYAVKQIDKGAFQGLGLITVILPEGLERIEDYAFSGNQLIGVTIPESVVHIGNYAFSFNEQTHSLTGEKRATIKTVMMYEGGQLTEQFENINQYGDILENSGGPKVDLLDERVTLLDHIFVTSIGNHVVDEEYGEADDGKGEPGQQSGPIIFYGPEELFDGDLNTGASGSKPIEITWDGDLTHREISITSVSTYQLAAGKVYLRFLDVNGNPINYMGETSTRKEIANNSKTTTKVIVPNGASKMIISGSGDGKLVVHEIQAPVIIERPAIQNVTSTQTSNSVTLNWGSNSRVQIFKDGKKIGEVEDNSTYTDSTLFSNEEQNYKLLFIDKYGNASLEFVEHNAKTEAVEITFRSPHVNGAAMFDGDLNTGASGSKPIEITWDGDLTHREISITSVSTYRFTGGKVYLQFLDVNGNPINHIGENSSRKEIAEKSKTSTKVIVPNGASKMIISGSYDGDLVVYEIKTPDTLERPSIQTVNSTQTPNSVTLNWGNNSRVQIFKNGKKIGEVEDNSTYTDSILFSNEEQNYKLLFIDKYGNASLEFVEHNAKTEAVGIIFRSPHTNGAAIFDGNLNTGASSSNPIEITWDGDLSHREISITSVSTYRFASGRVYLQFLDVNGNPINHIGENSSRKEIAEKSKTTTKVIVPNGAKKIRIDGNGYGSVTIYEITTPDILERPSIQTVTSTQTPNSVTLNWGNNSRVQIFKHGKKIGEVEDNSTYTDSMLFSNDEQNYELLFVDNYGNASLEFVEHNTKTEALEINFRSSHTNGAAIFDGNLNTGASSSSPIEITWDGDLSHREISITSVSTYRFASGRVYLRFLDVNNNPINHMGENSSTKEIANKSKTTTKVIVPSGAQKMSIDGNGYGSVTIYEITTK